MMWIFGVNFVSIEDLVEDLVEEFVEGDDGEIGEVFFF